MEKVEYFALPTTPTFAVITQAEVNAEIKETFQAAADWGAAVMLGGMALFFLAGLLSFMIWRGGD